MDDITEIFRRYELIKQKSICQDINKLDKLVVEFTKDLVQLIDMLSRLRNHETHPNYYNINESTIVGSLTRIVKLYKEYINFHKHDKLEIQFLFVRPLYESFIIIKYLMRNGEKSQENFRRISYQSRFKNYKKLIKTENKKLPIIERQLQKLTSKLKHDNLTIQDLEKENKKPFKKRWKLDGKSFGEIHKEVDNEFLYSFIYGGGSDSIHGSWQEIIDFHLTIKGKGYFGDLNYGASNYSNFFTINSIVIESINEYLTWNSCQT